MAEHRAYIEDSGIEERPDIIIERDYGGREVLKMELSGGSFNLYRDDVLLGRIGFAAAFRLLEEQSR